MLCKTFDRDLRKIYDKDRYEYSPKKDGTRCWAYFDGKGITKLINRRNYDILYKYPELKKLNIKNAVIDGELCCKDFATLMSREHSQNTLRIDLMSREYPVIFYGFDILEYNGKDLTKLTLTERKEYLSIFKEFENENFKILEYTDSLDIAMGWLKDNEGIVLKDKNSKYEKGVRSHNWLKYKNRIRQKIKFDGYEYNKDGSLTLINGFNRVKCNKPLLEIVKKDIDSKGFANCEVEGLEITANGHIRFPILQRVINN
tara:strand:+ start:1643 stop:2416 length:774 start_codon:yes stop_codon:yes gene_type:complete